MKNVISTLVAVLVTGSVVVSAHKSPHDAADQKHAKHRHDWDDRDDDRDYDRDHDRHADRDRTRGAHVYVVFSSHDVAVIRDYYGPRYRRLPPGLQKKLARGGSLPPGWQKKIEPFPILVERQLVVLPQGFRRGVMDGYAVIYNPRTQVIVDATVLF